MKRLSLLVTVLFASGTTALVFAQNASSRPVSTGHSVASFGFGPAGSTISEKLNAPFSAVAVERFEQTLNDGTNISRENRETVMRDSAGRVYRGRELKRSGNGERDPVVIFTITDPVKHIQFHCIAFHKHCTEAEYRYPRRFTQFAQPKHLPDVAIDELGDSNIGGVQVAGQRITRVVREGSAGNDRPFDTTEEIWHSKELDVDVEVKRTDPRFGVRETTLTEVRLAEQDSTFFQVPDGYQVSQLVQPKGAIAPLPESGLPAIPPVAPGIP